MRQHGKVVFAFAFGSQGPPLGVRKMKTLSPILGWAFVHGLVKCLEGEKMLIQYLEKSYFKNFKNFNKIFT